MEVWIKVKLVSGNFLWFRVEWDRVKNLGFKRFVCEKKIVSLEGVYMKVYVLIFIIVCKIIF